MTRSVNLEDLMWLSKEEIRRHIYAMSPSDIVEQIRCARSIDRMAWMIGIVHNLNYPYFPQVLAKLDHGALFERIYTEQDPQSVSHLIETLYKVGFTDLNNLDPIRLSKHIKSTTNLIGAKNLIKILAEIKYKYFQEAMKGVDTFVLEQRISDWRLKMPPREMDME